ncbi:MAG: PA0069 family radical SAM protein [Chlorobi bacterium]|nr:PA0069 family radical SAM protein [Chlorobiota bacterium]
MKGRGAGFNPPNRFEQRHYEDLFPESMTDEANGIKTEYIPDSSEEVVNYVKTPDLGLMHTINPYRGCEHGCIYCYARNSHEYLGFSAGLDFETKIVYKPDVARRLEEYLLRIYPRKVILHISTNTDCYQPIERKLKLTRQILEICLKYKNPVRIITKNALVLRDLDILKKMMEYEGVKVMITITTLNESLRRVMEPRTTTAQKRLETIKALASAGISVGVMVAPIIPGLTDHEIPSILRTAGESGASFASYTIVRLNGKLKDLFVEWLERNFPERKEKVLELIRSCHAGNLNDSKLGRRLRGDGNIADNIKSLFQIFSKKYIRSDQVQKGVPQAYRRKTLFDNRY